MLESVASRRSRRRRLVRLRLRLCRFEPPQNPGYRARNKALSGFIIMSHDSGFKGRNRGELFNFRHQAKEANFALAFEPALSLSSYSYFVSLNPHRSKSPIASSLWLANSSKIVYRLNLNLLLNRNQQRLQRFVGNVSVYYIRRNAQTN